MTSSCGTCKRYCRILPHNPYNTSSRLPAPLRLMTAVLCFMGYTIGSCSKAAQDFPKEEYMLKHKGKKAHIEHVNCAGCGMRAPRHMMVAHGEKHFCQSCAKAVA